MHKFTFCSVYSVITLLLVTPAEEKIVHDENILCEDNFKPFTEWVLVATAKHVAGNDEATLLSHTGTCNRLL